MSNVTATAEGSAQMNTPSANWVNCAPARASVQRKIDVLCHLKSMYAFPSMPSLRLNSSSWSLCHNRQRADIKMKNGKTVNKCK